MSSLMMRSSAASRSSARAQPAARRTALRVQAQLRSTSDPHVQLGTAKLPSNVAPAAMAEYLYQWAAGLTQSGANYPFSLPVKADKYDSGFKISLLKKMPAGNFDAAGEIQTTIEEMPGQGNVVMIRFFEGPAAMADRKSAPPANPQERLSIVLDSLVDVNTIMSTMPNALRNGVATCRA